MTPIINLDDIDNFERRAHGNFDASHARLSPLIGASKLGYSLTRLPPGKRAFPFHNHHINEEMFLILEGEGTLRFGDREYPLKPHDIIACPPGGREVAHQIINTGSVELRYLSLSTNESHDICEYPDSDKLLAVVYRDGKRAFAHVGRCADAVDYFLGE